MKALKTITLAALIAAASGVAHANDAAQYGRGTPGIDAGVSVPSVGASVDVATVQGRASAMRNAQRGKTDLTITARSVAEVQGRS